MDYNKGPLKPLVKKVLDVWPDAEVKITTALCKAIFVAGCDKPVPGPVERKFDELADKITGFC
jgi:hypothetical protein